MTPPASWLIEHAHLLPAPGRALDVACGRGRHALWLAERGFHVDAVDSSAEAVAEVNAIARARNLPVQATVVDLEVGPGSQSKADAVLGDATFDLVVVFNYLHRPLFPALLRALRPAGLLVYETFTRAQARRGKPSNPAFLLEPGELRRLVAPLEVLAAREGEFENRDVASVVARRAYNLAP